MLYELQNPQFDFFFRAVLANCGVKVTFPGFGGEVGEALLLKGGSNCYECNMFSFFFFFFLHLNACNSAFLLFL